MMYKWEQYLEGLSKLHFVPCNPKASSLDQLDPPLRKMNIKMLQCSRTQVIE